MRRGHVRSAEQVKGTGRMGHGYMRIEGRLNGDMLRGRLSG